MGTNIWLFRLPIISLTQLLENQFVNMKIIVKTLQGKKLAEVEDTITV